MWEKVMKPGLGQIRARDKGLAALLARRPRNSQSLPLRFGSSDLCTITIREEGIIDFIY